MKHMVVTVLASGCLLFMGKAADVIVLESWSWWVLVSIALGFGILKVTVQLLWPEDLRSRVVALFSRKARQDAEVAAVLSLWEKHGYPVLSREMASATELAGTSSDETTQD